ncbi:hypothetical protein GTS_20610 [Gandjariella thermophila]|uniref:Uncharacterized protein n=1 Tax=Gandjariella thermophila TaxID=1931992 RepID=A0A4D4J6V0_9PSEU|nr:hypothetical protein GTS_20610 [Gandjariella thermophila]
MREMPDTPPWRGRCTQGRHRPRPTPTGTAADRAPRDARSNAADLGRMTDGRRVFTLGSHGLGSPEPGIAVHRRWRAPAAVARGVVGPSRPHPARRFTIEHGILCT